MAPQFKGCPLPKHTSDAGERNSRITMVYFHPWTLNTAFNDEQHVPLLSNLKKGFDTWEAALTYWLDGHVISEESKRYPVWDPNLSY